MKSSFKMGISLILLFFLVFGCTREEEVLQLQNKLVAVAGDDKTVLVRDEVILDGSGSRDGNQKQFSYLWSITSKPMGSTAPLLESKEVTSTFIPDVAGIYSFQLEIVSGQFVDRDEVTVTVLGINQEPIPQDPTPVIISDPITGTRILKDISDDPSKPDYMVTNDLEVRGDLVIEPGVVIAFRENAGLKIITGSLVAKGTPGEEVVLKREENGMGYWKGIVVYSNNQNTILEHVLIKQAGSDLSGTGIRASVLVAGSAISGGFLKINNTELRDGGGYGLYVQGMSEIDGFSRNSFMNNLGSAVYLPARLLHKLDKESFAVNNTFDGVETSGPVLEEMEVEWKKVLNGLYRVNSTILLRAGITVEPGVTFQIASNYTIQVDDQGYLNANGSQAQPILFTSQAPGLYWNGLFFNSDRSENQLSFTHVSNAGQNRIADADHEANIAVGHSGKVSIHNSVVKNGLGYGVVTKSRDRVNGDIMEVNTFVNLQKGTVYPVMVVDPEQPALQGIWLDQWSFNQKAEQIAPNFYDRSAGNWFGGAANPWAMAGAGFGIQINEDGGFTWLIAEHSPMVGCESYSAEYITGTTSIEGAQISFNIEYWRSKFINSCDTSWNTDTEVTPFVLELPYTTTKMFNVVTQEEYWQLKFTNPDGSTFAFYRR